MASLRQELITHGRSFRLETIVACVAIAIASLAAIWSIPQEEGQWPAARPATHTPQSQIDAAFDVIRTSIINTVVPRRPPQSEQCGDFDLRFFGLGCAKMHEKHSLRFHRVGRIILRSTKAED
jgi:hypothetical protein